MVVMAMPFVSSLVGMAEPARAPSLDDNTNATRHLSAGAYLDPEFCRTALREVYYRTNRIVAPSHGFDGIAVLGHCLRARRAMVVRDALLVGLLLLVSWLSLVTVLATLATLLAVHTCVVSVWVVREAIRYIVSEGYFRANVPPGGTSRAGVSQGQGAKNPALGRPPRQFVRVWFENVLAQIVARLLGIVLRYLALLAVAVLAVWVWHTPLLGVRFGIPLSRAVTWSIALAFLIPALARAWSRLQLRALVPGRPPTPPVHNHRLREIARQTGGNTVVYSGYWPFVGSGDVLRSWDITQRLVRPVTRVPGIDVAGPEAAREFDKPPFTAEQISSYVRDYIADLSRDPSPERGLSDLTVTDRVFVAGTEISDLQPHTPARRLAEIIRRPTAPARHYLQCQVVSWRGELVTTVYVHVAVQGKALYVELNVLGLPPCDERYRLVDQVGGTSIRRMLGDSGRALFEAPVLVSAAPVSVARAAADLVAIAVAGRFRRRNRVSKGYDYGATTGLRELGSSAVTRDAMQTQDIVKYGRVVERRVLAAVLDFLEERGVDVTEYRQRSLGILSAGAVATSGGTVNVSGDAVGTLQQHNTTVEGSG
jgi:hypothetical protein